MRYNHVFVGFIYIRIRRPLLVRRLLRQFRRRDRRRGGGGGGSGGRRLGRDGWRHGGWHQAVIVQEVDRSEFWLDIEQRLFLAIAVDWTRRRRAVFVVRDERRGVRNLHVRVIGLQRHVHARAGLQED